MDSALALMKRPPGMCTLAIVMLETFPYGSLPRQDPFSHHVYADTDVASFKDLWLSADFIEICCLQSQNIPGWALAGETSRSVFWYLQVLIMNREARIHGGVHMDHPVSRGP